MKSRGGFSNDAAFNCCCCYCSPHWSFQSRGQQRERRKASEKLHENRHEEIIFSLLTTQLVSILNQGWPSTQEHPLGQGVLPQPRKHCSRLLLNCPALQLQGQGSRAREFLRLWLLLTSLSRTHCFMERNAFSVPNTHKNSEKGNRQTTFGWDFMFSLLQMKGSFSLMC